jgi:hypothetical protein
MNGHGLERDFGPESTLYSSELVVETQRHQKML